MGEGEYQPRRGETILAQRFQRWDKCEHCASPGGTVRAMLARVLKGQLLLQRILPPQPRKAREITIGCMQNPAAFHRQRGQLGIAG